MKHNQRRREPERQQRGQCADEAEQERELQHAATLHLFAGFLAAGKPGKQRSTVDQRGRRHRERHPGEKDQAQRQQRPEIAPEAAEQITQRWPAAALLAPRGGEKADGKHGLQYRRGELAQRRPWSQLRQRHQHVIGNEQQQPRERCRPEHRVRTTQPENAAARIAAHERDRGWRRVERRHKSGKRGSAATRLFRMRSNTVGSWA
ncbi:MAG: hypothetical protein E6H78_07580 [Betaproteobacteria bacterium]|nr:MAG: hypothetical protein E6H78_07580 [Betaproteobacteria bacterium]